MCSYLPLKAWWYSESEVGKWGRVEWAKRLARQLFLWWKSWYASHSIVPHRAQGTCSCWLEHFCWDHWQVERWCELYIQVPFQKHVRESKQSDKAVLSIHKDRNDRVPPSEWQCSWEAETLPYFAGPVLLISLASCVGISNRMDYFMNEKSIALDSDFTSYLYHLLAGRPGLTSQSVFPQL